MRKSCGFKKFNTYIQKESLENWFMCLWMGMFEYIVWACDEIAPFSAGSISSDPLEGFKCRKTLIDIYIAYKYVL